MRRGFGGRGPLCGIGVSSAIRVTSIPLPAKPRSADSRPAPTPRIITSTSLTPMITRLVASSSSPTFASHANGVPLLAPEKPSAPEEDQATVLPLLVGKQRFGVVVGRVNMERAGHDGLFGDASERAGLEPLVHAPSTFSDDTFLSHGFLCFLQFTAAGCHCFADVAANGARVGLGALAACGQVRLVMARATVMI